MKMNRDDAMALAQKKANDWNKEFRVLRFLDRGSEQVYEVESSYDSPKGFRLVEVFHPKKVSLSLKAYENSKKLLKLIHPNMTETKIEIQALRMINHLIEGN